MKLNRPRGTRDFTPVETEKRRYIENRMRGTAEHWGYGEVKTPTFENAELFTIKSGEAILDELYTFKDKGGRDIALRPELTAPVLRMYVNEMSVSPKPIRLYYFENCFRYERPQKGRFREFWQFGVELIGSDRAQAEAEAIALAAAMVSDTGIAADLHIGHLGVVRGLLHGLDAKMQADAMRLMDKKDVDGLRMLLSDQPDLRERLPALLDADIDEARSITDDAQPLEELQATLALLDHYGVRYEVDFGIVRGLDYYTGMVFEMYAAGLGAQNQICGGGTYRLAQLFGGSETPSCGFGIGFDRVLEVCEIEPPHTQRVAVVYLPDVAEDAIRVASRLRDDAGVCTTIDISGRKFGQQLKHADAIGADYAVIVGAKEVEAGMVTLRDMQTGEQEMLGLDDAILRIMGDREGEDHPVSRGESAFLDLP
ncbi:MAG: histidine--tRNA ligase [Euryarchaeota archaeon]|nr:histidine--tRNA ligase [Euryarchaeota archaeon]